MTDKTPWVVTEADKQRFVETYGFAYREDDETHSAAANVFAESRHRHESQAELVEVVQLYLDWGSLSPADIQAKYPEMDHPGGVNWIDARARAILAKIGGAA